MSVQTGQVITKCFTTRVFATGARTNADSLPTGKLYLNGVANAAAVTVSLTADSVTGMYYASVTLPTLTFGDIVDLRVTVVMSSITDNGIIWSDTCNFPDIYSGSATSTGTTSTLVDTALPASSLVGRTIIFGGGSANPGTQALITAHNLGTNTLTFAAVANAVVNGDKYRVY